jgi:Fe-S oxidoreductase
MNRVSAHRWFLEKALGIDRRKDLPEFAGTTFERWAASNGRIADAPGAEVVLFQTCYVQNNEPQIGRDALEVLDRNQVRSACVKGLACCGMPAWEHGDLDTLRANAAHNLERLMPFVDAGAKVLPINPTCSMMMRREYPELVAPADRERATKLAAAVMDPSEYVWSIRNEPRFNASVKSRPAGPLAYHAPCHLRAQSVGFRSRDLFKKLLGAEVVPVMECCGHDGTYAMTTEGFEPAQRAGARAFADMQGADATTWSTECPLAAIQFAQFAGTKPLHPMTILARAYRGDPFPKTRAVGGESTP